MFINSRTAIIRAQAKSQGADLSGRHKRVSWSLPVFASVVSLGFVATLMMAAPTPASVVSAAPAPVSSIERAEV
ncbi:MAG: hypothetical protein ACSHW9_05580, partial [Salinibacterium amurskyense]